MRQRYTAVPGASLPAIALQTGRMRGIEIDNPSGSWLYIPSLDTYVPPYTLGWSHSFPYMVEAVDIRAGVSPAGQVNTVQGDPIIVYLTDQEVPNSEGSPDPGAPFIQRFTPVLSIGAFQTVGVTNSFSAVIVPAIPSKRFRILTISLEILDINGNGAVSPTLITVGPTTGFSPIVRLNDRHMHHDFIFSEGLDCPVGDSIEWGGNGMWKDESVFVFVTYQVI